jgi:N-acetylmuramoyl-L-alanine amidase
MATGKELFEIIAAHVGEQYSFGAIAPKNQRDYVGPWDCAEIGSWGVYQLTNRLYGCYNNAGNPAGADAYSGYWIRDAKSIGTIISIEKAAKIPGAALLREEGNGIPGHVAFSSGEGDRTAEAHSTKTGVIFSHISGRRWDFAVLVPWIFYDDPGIVTDGEIDGPHSTIYRYKHPLMQGKEIKVIQRALQIPDDGIFGQGTFNAVRAFQLKKGLNPDGEVGPKTIKALGIDL